MKWEDGVRWCPPSTGRSAAAVRLQLSRAIRLVDHVAQKGLLRANRRSRTRFVEWAQRLDEAAEVLTDGAPLSFTITAGTSGGGAANGDVPPAVDGPEPDLHHARHR